MTRQRQGDPIQGAKGGQKRKRKDDHDIADTEKHALNVNTAQYVATAAHSQPAEVLSGFQRMDEETTTYLTEVKAHLDTLDDREEISLLVGNALEELQGKELKAATDAACSRILEALIVHAAPDAFLGLMNALTDGQEWCKLSARPFGSRVAETLLRRLEALLEEDLDEQAVQALQQVLTKTTDVTVEHLYEFATDRNASHVARRLLCVIAGHDVIPPQQNSSSMDASAVKANKGKGLATKLEGQLPAQRKPAQHPQQLEKLATALVEPKWDTQKDELLFHAYACPWLQALLKACAGERDVLAWLVPRLLGAKPQGDSVEERKAAVQNEGLKGIQKEHVQGLMQDRTSSHLLEVVMQVVPELLLEQLYTSFLRGSLAALAMHPLSNFAVQAYLSALQTSQQVRSALRELRDSFAQLLRGRRAGVPAALLAAAARAGNAALQVDAAKALLTATAALQTCAGEQGPAAGLLTLDCAAKLGEAAGRARLSTLGAAMLSTLMRFDKEACAAFAVSIAELAPAELLHMGMDSAGSRSLEAFLGSVVSAKVKKHVIRKLAGSYAKLGSSPGGSHVAQACYRTAGVKDKEVIATELAAAEEHIGSTAFGQMLLQRCAIEEFKRSSDNWRSHAKTAAALRSEFAELLGDAEEPAQRPGPIIQSARPAQRALGRDEAASRIPAVQLPADEAEASKPKKVKRKASAQPGQPDIGRKQASKKSRSMPAVQLPEQPAAGGESSKPKKRQKGIKTPAVGGTTAAAEVEAEHASRGAKVKRKLSKAAKLGHAAPPEVEALGEGDSNTPERQAHMSAGHPLEGPVPEPADENLVKKRIKQKRPAAFSSDITLNRTVQSERETPPAQQSDTVANTGKAKKAKKHKPKELRVKAL